jgi:hypothetical protein
LAKTVNITGGTGTADLINGSYTVSSEVAGYDNTSINPSSVSIIEGTNSYAFTLAATGTLTLHVTEDGTVGGTPIVGATFIRTDSTGNEYGSVITTDASGDAIFANVPYDATNAPLIYYKQMTSDGDHEFSSAVVSTSLTTQTETNQVANQPGATRTINLTDANYVNLPIESGTLTLTI